MKETVLFLRAIALACGLVTVLVGIFFALERPWGYEAAAAHLLTIAVLFLVWRVRAAPARRLLAVVLVLLSAQFGLFLLIHAGSAQVASLRLLQVSITVFYVATMLSVGLAVTRRVAGLNALALSFSLALGFVLCEILLGLPMSGSSGQPEAVPRWVGPFDPHPRLGVVYRPHSVLRTYYPDNARGYFKEEDDARAKWLLNLDAGNQAVLTSQPGTPGRVRVAITEATVQPDWGIQLRQPRLTLKQGERYAVEFRARADQPRRMAVGITQGYPPWKLLGLYEEVALSSRWQRFDRELVATTTDSNAQVIFNVGASPIPVELEEVRLRNVANGRAVEPTLEPNRYLVSYRFNELGCRGRDYAIPRPAGTSRILLLGDSYTLGVGVHEEDTFAHQLEGLLNQEMATASGRRYDVVNCGVSGYGTREERILYELVGAQYTPDVVLLVVGWTDDMSFLEEEKKGYINRQRGRLEEVFYTWALIQDYRHRRPFPDFSKCAEEILQLQAETRKQGGRLGVLIFRVGSGRVWERLDAQLSGVLRANGIPLFDLGNAFWETHTPEELWVHPRDEHLNEIAHRIAAREILGFLRREDLLAP